MDFSELIQNRYSVRDYREQKIERKLLEKVLDAGRLAPSAANRQAWKFIAVDDEEILQKVYGAYAHDWFRSASAVIVICGNHETSWKRSFDQKDLCDTDAAIAIDHMTLMATELGLGTCWICHFKTELIRKHFSIPKFWEPIALLPIGHPKSSPPAIKDRKNLGEVVSWNKFA